MLFSRGPRAGACPSRSNRRPRPRARRTRGHREPQTGTEPNRRRYKVRDSSGDQAGLERAAHPHGEYAPARIAALVRCTPLRPPPISVASLAPPVSRRPDSTRASVVLLWTPTVLDPRTLKRREHVRAHDAACEKRPNPANDMRSHFIEVPTIVRIKPGALG